MIIKGVGLLDSVNVKKVLVADIASLIESVEDVQMKKMHCWQTLVVHMTLDYFTGTVDKDLSVDGDLSNTDSNRPPKFQ